MGNTGSSRLLSRIGFILVICVLAWAPAQPGFAGEPVLVGRGGSPHAERFADAHSHIIDFLQNGAFDNRDGRFAGAGPRGRIEKSPSVRYLALPYGQQWRRLTLLLADMDEANVDHAMICGLPFLKKWSENEPFARPAYYLDSSSRMVLARDTDYPLGAAVLDYRRQFAGDPRALRELERIYPFVCGFDSTDLGAVDLVIKRIKQFPGVWTGIGEVMSRHDDLTNLTTGDRPRANHPALKRLCRFAGEWFLPVSIHHNIAPVSRSAKEVKGPTYLDELVELFQYCRSPGAAYETKFIWCHAGISRRVVVDDLPHWIDVMLHHFSGQVYIDLSWVVYEDYILTDLESWAALVTEYPEAFMLGSDVVGGAEKMGGELHRYTALLDAIAEDSDNEIRRNLVRDNFVRLMTDLGRRRRAKMDSEKVGARAMLQSGGLVLRPDYEYDERAHTGARVQSFMQDNAPEP